MSLTLSRSHPGRLSLFPHTAIIHIASTPVFILTCTSRAEGLSWRARPKYGMNITHILLNNQELGKITKEQKSGRFEVWETDLHNPDFSRYAEVCGALGIRVSKTDELEAALERAFEHQGPSLVEVISDTELI